MSYLEFTVLIYLIISYSGTEEKHYTVRPIDLLRKWHIEYENWILEQALV